MDLTPVEEQAEGDSLEGQDPQAYAEGVLKSRIANLIDKVSSVLFSYVAQVRPHVNLPGQLPASKARAVTHPRRFLASAVTDFPLAHETKSSSKLEKWYWPLGMSHHSACGPALPSSHHLANGLLEQQHL